MRTHLLKATYTVSIDGEVTDGDPDGGAAASGWGSGKIQWNATEGKWERVP